MYDQLRARLASLLSKPRSLKPQTQRQLEQHLAEHSSDLASFLLCASAVLEEYELDIVFGPVFTQTLQERAEYGQHRVNSFVQGWRGTGGRRGASRGAHRPVQQFVVTG